MMRSNRLPPFFVTPGLTRGPAFLRAVGMAAGPWIKSGVTSSGGVCGGER